MTKAYDRVSWDYICLVIRRMGFEEPLIDMVWIIMANNWYSIIINGWDFCFFQSSRGLKKGVPHSPTLIFGAKIHKICLNGFHNHQDYHGLSCKKRDPKWTTCVLQLTQSCLLQEELSLSNLSCRLLKHIRILLSSWSIVTKVTLWSIKMPLKAQMIELKGTLDSNRSRVLLLIWDVHYLRVGQGFHTFLTLCLKLFAWLQGGKLSN